MSQARLMFPTLLGSAFFALVLLIYPGQARADALLSSENMVLAMVGMTDDEMAAEEAAAQASGARPGDPDYEAPQVPADDSSMALIVALVFGLPVATWAIMREIKKTRSPRSE